jgi:hypothetical protein
MKKIFSCSEYSADDKKDVKCTYVRHIDDALVRDDISSLADMLHHLSSGEAKESLETPRF